MIRAYIVCEGPTEETFVNEVLEPVLRPFRVGPRACLIGPPGHKGGKVSRERVENDVLRILKQDRGAYCTTFLDYYGLAPGFPGKPAPERTPTERKAELVEQALYQDVAAHLDQTWRPDRFIPYIQMHEFEGLLFSDPARLAKGLYKPELADRLQEIRKAFPTPEDINDNFETAPSNRIRSLLPGYDKPVAGTLAAIEIGIETIRKQCPRFRGWVERLSRLSGPGDGQV
jgi:hypothetical protein